MPDMGWTDLQAWSPLWAQECEADIEAIFEDGPERRVPAPQQPRKQGGSSHSPEQPQTAGFSTFEGLWRQRHPGQAQGDPLGNSSSTDNIARVTGRGWSPHCPVEGRDQMGSAKTRRQDSLQT